VIHFPDHHGEAEDETEDKEEEGAPLTWDLDNVELTTVGVDIGTSTSHLLFARLHLQRLAQELSSRFGVVRREILYRSPVRLTPYRPDGLIDAEALRVRFQEAYAEAGLARDQVDTGAVILTGVALERENARAVADLFADSGGRFVCATAGHNLEAILAAHGSGAAPASRGAAEPRLHLDVGGGTTKLALIAAGEILETAAVAVGGRLVTFDEAGAVERIEPAAHAAARAAGVELRAGVPLSSAVRRRLAEAMTGAVLRAARGERWGLAGEVMLTPSLSRGFQHLEITCSGGVSEYLAGGAAPDVGDLGPELAEALDAGFAGLGCRLRPLSPGIRATVIGASQFTVQLSGSTVHVPRPELLPLRNLPVISPRLDGDLSAAGIARAIRRARARLDLTEALPLAVTLVFPGEPSHETLRELALGVADALSAHLERELPVIVALDADVARSLGRVMEEELGPRGTLIVVDGLELVELDYVDLGEIVRPAGVIPVVIKSLAFAGTSGTLQA
jgi:ethanolamine utilization protein EutA